MRTNRRPLERVPLMERFEGMYTPEPNSGCWLWLGAPTFRGYGEIKVWITDKIKRSQRAHRVSWTLFRGPIPPGMVVCHHCDNRACVNPDHLFLGTQLDNVRDMIKKNRQVNPVGTRNSSAVLTESQVLEIRDSNEPQGVLAARYGVCDANISAIKTRKSWKHLGEAA